MTNRNTEDIDKLFREGLNPDDSLFTVPEGEWPRLERRLAQHAQKRRGIVWLTRLGGVVALILLFFTLRIFWPGETEQAVQQPPIQQKAPEQALPQSKVQTQEQEITAPRDSSGDASHKGITTPDNRRGANTGLAQNRNRQEAPDNRQRAVAVQEMGTADWDTLQVGILQVPEPASEPKAGLPKDNAMASVPLQHDSIKPADQRFSATDEPLLAVLEEPANEPIIEPGMRKMTISVLAAPDYNGVDNLSNASLGSDFGLLVSVAIAKNWSFSTGGIYAKKLYETGYSNYTPAQDIWNEYHPRSVYADCRVLDIPLNISYTFLRARNSAFSAGSGISSYIMLKEDYRFNYAETHTDAIMNYQVMNGSRHWLSVVNLQATFEQRLSSRFSVSLQPYMKIPLSAVGFAGVKLHTLGLAANLNWNFNL